MLGTTGQTHLPVGVIPVARTRKPRRRAQMSTQAKVAAAVAGVLVLAVGAFFLTGNKDSIPLVGGVLDPEPATCPLTGLEPRREAVLDRPAVAVKIVNASPAYPLSGLEDAEVVFEELVEGGITRFMAIYHCTDSDKAGPVRSARTVDPAIMTPLTRILAFSGANAGVFAALDEAGIVQIEENTSGGALERVPREGLAFEHTLYANISELRKIGRKDHPDPPPGETFTFGEIEGKSRKASAVTINFSGFTTVGYAWDGEGWARSQGGVPFMTESGEQITADNVLIEEHDIVASGLTDVAGNQSVEISDVTGEGRAVLLRDGRMMRGTWTRDSVEAAVQFETRDGERFRFAPGTIWVHLVPSKSGDIKGSFSFER